MFIMYRTGMTKILNWMKNTASSRIAQSLHPLSNGSTRSFHADNVLPVTLGRMYYNRQFLPPYSAAVISSILLDEDIPEQGDTRAEKAFIQALQKVRADIRPLEICCRKFYTTSNSVEDYLLDIRAAMDAAQRAMSLAERAGVPIAVVHIDGTAELENTSLNRHLDMTMSFLRENYPSYSFDVTVQEATRPGTLSVVYKLHAPNGTVLHLALVTRALDD